MKIIKVANCLECPYRRNVCGHYCIAWQFRIKDPSVVPQRCELDDETSVTQIIKETLEKCKPPTISKLSNITWEGEEE